MDELDDDEMKNLLLKVNEIKEKKRQRLLLSNQSDINETTADRESATAEDELYGASKNPQTPSSELSRSDTISTTASTSSSHSSSTSSSSPNVIAEPCPNPFMVLSSEISQDQFNDRLTSKLSNQVMEFFLSKELQEFCSWRASFLLNFTEEEVSLDDAALESFNESAFRDSFSSLITAGVLVQRAVRVKGGKGTTEDSPIRVQFLQLIYRFWNILGTYSYKHLLKTNSQNSFELILFIDFDVKGYGNSIPNHQQIVSGWSPMNIRFAFAKHVDNFLFNGVKTISTPSETYELSLEQGMLP